MNILIVEDELVVADYISGLMTLNGHTVCGIAQTAADALLLFKEGIPDLVICDIQLRGDEDGISFHQASSTVLKVPFIYLTAYADQMTISRVAVADPVAYLIKPFTAQQLLSAVALSEVKMKQLADKRPVLGVPSKRELEVLSLIAKGYASKQIAEQLFISDHTVQAHRRNLMERYETQTSIELVMLGLRQGWITL